MEKKKKAKSSIIDKVKKLVKKEPEKKQRGHYKLKECPYCHRHVGNLGNHIKLKHPLEEPQKELTKEDLITPKKPQPRESIIYYCINCHAEVRKDENPCWKCGESLNWSALNE